MKFSQAIFSACLATGITFALSAAAFPGCPAGQSGGAHHTGGYLTGLDADCLTMMCHPIGSKVRQTHVGTCMSTDMPPVFSSCTIVDYEYTMIAADVPKPYCVQPLYSRTDWH